MHQAIRQRKKHGCDRVGSECRGTRCRVDQGCKDFSNRVQLGACDFLVNDRERPCDLMHLFEHRAQRCNVLIAPTHEQIQGLHNLREIFTQSGRNGFHERTIGSSQAAPGGCQIGFRWQSVLEAKG